MRKSELKKIVYILAALLLSIVNAGMVTAETQPPEELQIPGRIEGNGTHFEMNNSEYLNITLDSSEPIKLVLESIPATVTMLIEPVSDAYSTNITLSGFLPLTTYHRYEDDYYNYTAFTTDNGGNYTYTQELIAPHFVFIKPNESADVDFEEIQPLDEFQIPWRTEGNGTHFELNNSEYLNITLDSSEPVKLVLESIPETVTMLIEPVSDAYSTTITLSGFLPLTTYHKYEDDYHNHTTFTTDASGNYTYTQDLSKQHHVFIQFRPSTKFIHDDSTGGDCTSIGTWDIANKTCRLTSDVYETIQIDSDGVILDGNGNKIMGNSTGNGIYLYGRTDVIVRNLNVTNFSNGIYLYSSSNNVIINNTILTNQFGITILASSNNILSGNIARSNNMYGIHLDTSTNNILSDNTISNITDSSSGTTSGIYFINSENNALYNNIITNITGGIGGAGGYWVSGSGGTYWVGSGGTGGTVSGIYLSGSNNNTLTSNTINNMTGGIGGTGGYYWVGGRYATYWVGSGGTGGTASGIYLSGSSNNTLTGNTIKNMIGGIGGIGGYTGSGGTGGIASGIYLSGSSNNTLTGNTANNMTGGIGGIGGYRGGSGGTGGIASGAYLSGSNNNTLAGNTINKMTGGTGGRGGGATYGSGSAGGYGLASGIYFTNSTNNVLSGNIVSIIGSASHVGYGVYLEPDGYQNTIEPTNTMDSDPIVYLYNVDEAIIENYKLTTSSNPTNLGKIVLINSTNITIRNNTLTNMTGGMSGTGRYDGRSGGTYLAAPGSMGGIASGIYLFGSNNNTLAGNAINNMAGGIGGTGGYMGSGGIGGIASGIYLSGSNNNTLTGNNINNMSGGIGGTGGYTGSGGTGGTSSGIYLSGSNNNTLTGNTINNTNGGVGGGGGDEYSSAGAGGISAGIYLSGSTINTISGNLISNISGGIGGAGKGRYGRAGASQIGYGVYLESNAYQNTIETTNTMDGDPIVYLYNVDGAIVENYKLIANSNPTNLGKIVLINSTQVILRNNIIGNMTGESGATGGNRISGGSGGLSSGIYLLSSTNNKVTTNIISNMKGGIGGVRGDPFNSENGGAGGIASGIYLSDSTNNILSGNIISSMSGGSCGSDYGSGGYGIGIYLNSNSNNNTATNNVIQNNNGGECGGWAFSSGSNGYGIYLSASSNNTFTDNTIQGNIGGSSKNYNGGQGYGIHLSSSNGNIFTNNTVQNNNGGSCSSRFWCYGGYGYGIYLDISDNDTFTGNTVQNINGGYGGYRGGYGYGIYLSSSLSNIINDNYFNNSNNFGLSVSTNIWNILKTQGTNIVGGPYLGGNFWANPGGTGFSQTCTDAYGDGICDTPYALDESNIDYLPLSLNFSKDAIPPETFISISGTLGNNGWNTSDVQVKLTATDNEGGLGVAKTEYSTDNATWLPYTTPFIITAEGTATLQYRSVDNAGNVESLQTQTLKIDKTPPIITGTPTTSPNSNGWYNTDVVVHFTSSDAISGIDIVTSDTTISIEGGSQSVIGTVVDMAGNSASTTVSGINIDKTPSQVTINTPANGDRYILGQVLTADWSVYDFLSGIASATGTLPSSATIDTGTVGTKTFTVTATDNADNIATQIATYTIAYNFSDILPPINIDGSSIFKLGSTVPVKFRIADANGNYVSTAVANLTYQKITDDILGTIEEAVSTSEANEGNTFRYDSTDNLYIFNLGTNGMTAGTYQLNINLDDGTVHTVRISLR